MSTQSLVFLKQLVENAEYANEQGILRVIELAGSGDEAIIKGTSFAAGALDTLVRLVELRPDLLTPTVISQLERLANNADRRTSSAARAALETRGERAATQPSTGETLQRTKPASPRSETFGQLRQELEAQYPGECADDDDSVDIHSLVRQHLEKNFAPPEWRFDYFLTPGELCDLVDCYADQLIVRIDETDKRLSATSAFLVSLKWKAHPSIEPITVVGLWAFPSAREAREVWAEMGVYSNDTPVERILDIRDRFALNFRHGSYAVNADAIEEIEPSALGARMQRYCQALGAPLA